MANGKSSAVQLLESFINDGIRGGEKTINGVTSKSIEQVTQSLLFRADNESVVDKDLSSWATIKQTLPGDVTEVTYKFIAGNGSNIVAFNDVAQSTFKDSAAVWSDVANVRYTEVTGDHAVDVDVYINKTMTAAGGGSFPGSVDQDFVRTNFQPTDSNYSHQIVTHELGHSLGLAHSFQLGNYAENNQNYSVMSYSTAADIGQGDNSAWAVSPQIDDIAAVQKLYGANMTTRADDTVYGFNSTTDQRQFSFSSDTKELKLPFAIWDAGGNDTLDFSGFAQNQRIDLNEGKMSDVGGHKANMGIALGVTIENAIGGSGNDVMIGNAQDNEIQGGAGNDIIYGAGGADPLFGGAGADTFVYTALSDSTVSQADKINDFVSGQDKIDVSGLLSSANFEGSLNFVSAFTGTAGDAVLNYDASSQESSLAIDLSGAGTAQFLVNLVGQAAVNDIVV